MAARSEVGHNVRALRSGFLVLLKAVFVVIGLGLKRVKAAWEPRD